MSAVVDRESEALSVIVLQLDSLQTTQQQRVLAFVNRRFAPPVATLPTGRFLSVRTRIAVLYSLIGIALMAVTSLFGDRVYRLAPENGMADLWRYLWVLPFVFLGIAARAYQWRRYDDTPWPAYWRYPLWVAAAGFLYFASCHSFLDLSNWLYYPTSAIVVFGLGLVPGLAKVLVPAFGR